MTTTPKPAPAPEPQGSEEPIDLPRWDLPLAEPGISSRLSDESIEKLARLMATETSWDHAKVNAHADEMARAYLALRAELAQAREEIARLSEIIEQRDVDWATERAARERAESLVKGLIDVLGEVLEALRVHAPGTALNSREFDFLGYKARAILARAKEGEKR